MKKTRMMLTVCVAALAVCACLLAGCSKKEAGAAAAPKDDRGYDIYWFNAKGENAAQVDAMAKAYTEETGVRVKTFSIGAGADQDAPMNTEMNSKNPPSIYSIQGIKNLAMWLDGGFVVNLAEVTDPPEFKQLVADIAPGLRMSLGDGTSYGIPYNVEGYGFIVDRKMLADLFGATDNADAAIAALKACTWDEWKKFVETVHAWIAKPSAAKVTLAGKEFALAASKTDMTSKLIDVYTIMGSETWTYGDHFINIPLTTVFTTQMDALNATADQIKKLHNPLIAYTKALELKSDYVAGLTKHVDRSPDLVSSSNFGYDQAVQIFTEGKALFLKQGNWAYNNIANVDKATAERLYFLPMKMPFNQSDIVAKGMTIDRLNKSIPVFVPNYYAVNATVSKEEQQAAFKFLAWMNTSKTGQHFIVDEMAFIPYNADPATTKVPNSLGNSILDYMKAGDTLPGIFLAVPGTWPGTITGAYIRENYLVKKTWTDADREAIANYAVDEWIKLLAK